MYIIANGIGIVLLIILLTIAIIVKIVSGEVNKRCQYSSKKNFLDEGEALNVEEALKGFAVLIIFIICMYTPIFIEWLVS